MSRLLLISLLILFIVALGRILYEGDWLSFASLAIVILLERKKLAEILGEYWVIDAVAGYQEELDIVEEDGEE